MLKLFRGWASEAKNYISYSLSAFIKSKYSNKGAFTHFQAEVFENLISKDNFQWSDGSEYVSNMSHIIKIIILDGS